MRFFVLCLLLGVSPLIFAEEEAVDDGSSRKLQPSGIKANSRYYVLIPAEEFPKGESDRNGQQPPVQYEKRISTDENIPQEPRNRRDVGVNLVEIRDAPKHIIEQKKV